MKRLLCLIALVACGRAPELKPIRDVRPQVVGIDEKLTIETSVPLTTGVPTEIELEGRFSVPGQPDAQRTVIIRNARTTSQAAQVTSQRVVADIDSLFEREVGGHAQYHGFVTVLQGGKPVARACCFDLDLFPKSVRSLAYALVGGKEAGDLTDWLGLKLHQVAAPDGKGTVLQVERVQHEFAGIEFLAQNDCGIWDEQQKQCKAPLDARVERGEALSHGVDAELFDEIDSNHDGQVDRIEAHHHDRSDSPAAVAGLQKGDFLVSAGGEKLTSLDDLRAAWKSEGPLVSVGLLRDGKEMQVSLPRHGEPASIPEGFLFAGLLVIVGLLVVLPVPVLGGLIVVWERKIAGRMQSRPGPNRVGPNGWLQWLADGLKLITKEDIIPRESDPILFRISPYLVFMGVFSTFVVLPISQLVVVADLNVGILYLLSVTSLVVVGIIMGGWASNSKWSLLGGMRSAAQIISYELPASIAVLSVVVLSGTLSTQGIVKNQGGAPWNWHMFDNPFTFVCFFIYFISALAEGNRTPFDLPEAESELVSGYNTEYSGFRFSIYFLAEWVNLIVIGGVATTVFLGGWQIPHVSVAAIERSLFLQLLSLAVFATKTAAIIFVIIWVRWTLPRFRVDQMMNMCWKYFLPISMASFVAVAGWVWLAPYPSMLRMTMRFAMFVVMGLGTLVYFGMRVKYTRKTTRVLELRGA